MFLSNTEIPAPKRKCWESTGEKFKQKLERIRELKSNAAKTLLTFFSVRGKKSTNILINYYNETTILNYYLQTEYIKICQRQLCH